jgi:predicted transcriptional regulator
MWGVCVAMLADRPSNYPMVTDDDRKKILSELVQKTNEIRRLRTEKEVISALGSKWATSQEIAEKLGKNKTYINSVLLRLKDEGRVEREQGAVRTNYWRLR